MWEQKKIQYYQISEVFWESYHKVCHCLSDKKALAFSASTRSSSHLLRESAGHKGIDNS